MEKYARKAREKRGSASHVQLLLYQGNEKEVGRGGRFTKQSSAPPTKQQSSESPVGQLRKEKSGD